MGWWRGWGDTSGGEKMSERASEQRRMYAPVQWVGMSFRRGGAGTKDAGPPGWQGSAVKQGTGLGLTSGRLAAVRGRGRLRGCDAGEDEGLCLVLVAAVERVKWQPSPTTLSRLCGVLWRPKLFGAPTEDRS